VIDYVSLDIEGHEMSVVRAWPWNEWCVNAWTVEDNDWCPEAAATSYMPELNSTLLPKGYEYRGRLGVDVVYVKSPPCEAHHQGQQQQAHQRQQQQQQKIDSLADVPPDAGAAPDPEAAARSTSRPDPPSAARGRGSSGRSGGSRRPAARGRRR
ncbi:MAG: hypothetical protein ACPGSK_05200, partial [Alphaproteobacteria bacterium]